MKTAIIILSLILVGIAAIFFAKGCNAPAPKEELEIRFDSLKERYDRITLEGEARYKSDSSFKHNIIIALDTTTRALAEKTRLLNERDKQIASTNKTLHAALIIHDTPEVYKAAEHISFQLDSMAQEKWNVDRELDRQQVLNEQLRRTDSIALSNCRGDLKSTRSAASTLVTTLEEQKNQAEKTAKKAKRGKGLWAVIGGAIGIAIKSIF